MAAKKTDLDDDLARLYRGPLAEFIAARNELAKQVGKREGKAAADEVRALPKPTPSAWAVNALFEHEAERMGDLLAAGERARAGQKAAVAGKGPESLRASLEAARKLVEELRRRGAALLTAAGVAASKATSERLGTNLQALAFSPAAEAEAARRWLDRDLDPPGFEVLAGLQLAGAPVVDFAARKAEREAKKEKEEKPEPERKLHAVPPPARGSRDEEERERREAAERAQAEREAERRRRRIAVAEEKLERARKEAAAAKEEVAQAHKAAAEARRRAEAAEAAAGRAEEKAGRAAERVAHAEDELKAAKEGN